jgi:uncharacterized protein
MFESAYRPEPPPASGPPVSEPAPSEPAASLMHEPPRAGGPAFGPGHPAGDRLSGEYSTVPQPQAGPTAPYPTAGYAAAGSSGPQYTGPLSPTERNWATAAHLSGFVAAWFALGFLGPLVVMLTEGSRSPFVRRHAVEALNFNLSVLLWLALSVVLILVLVGLIMIPAIGILYLVSSILGAMAASRGDDFRYPLTIRFVH